MKRFVSLALMLAMLAVTPRSRAAMQDVQTVFIILMENHDWASIRGSASAPYINTNLLPMASYAAQYYNPPGLHPSEPNYIWLEAGSNLGITTDADPSSGHSLSTTAHLVTQLKNAGISWTSYQEDITGSTCPIASSGLYAAKHNPMIFFNDVSGAPPSTSSAECIANVRPYTELAADLANHTVTRYNFLTPNLCNDMHNSSGCTTNDSIKNGDNWLAANIPAILNSQAYSNNGAIFITWDEGTGTSDGPLGMIVLSRLAKGGGYTNTIHYTHSSTLRSFQEIFNVGPFLNDAANATDLSDLFATITATGATLTAESCTPGNGAVDPGETVTANITIAGTGHTSNLIVTLLATGGVTAPSSPQTYGVVSNGASQTRPFTFTATGSCGGNVTATFQLQDGPTSYGTTTFIFPLGVNLAPLTENFDGASLPAGWATSATGAQSNWVVSASAAFSPNPVGVGDNALDTPSVAINSAAAQLSFRQSYNLTASTTNSGIGYDGGVLEINIGGGGYADILAAGGSFVSGGYNRTNSSSYGNPLAGRPVWSGNSAGYTTTVVSLPSSAAGQNVQLRWRCGTGNAPTLPAIAIQSTGTLAYWNFDGSNPAPVTVGANLSASIVTTVNANATSYVPGNPGTGQAITATGFSTAAAPTASTGAHTFSLTISNGYRADLASISFDDARSGSGPTNFLVQISQTANFSTTNYDSGAQTSHTSITSGANSFPLAISNLTGTIYFRLYGYKAGSTAGTWRIDNVNVQGSTAPAITGWYVDSVAINDPSCCSTNLSPFEAWQMLYFGSTTDAAALAGADPDGDGLSNLQEFQAGTVPTNSASALRITGVVAESNGVRVTWLTAPGRTNACDWSSDGDGGFSNNFTTIFTATNIVGTSTNYLDGNATNFPARYYRIRLVP